MKQRSRSLVMVVLFASLLGRSTSAQPQQVPPAPETESPPVPAETAPPAEPVLVPAPLPAPVAEPAPKLEPGDPAPTLGVEPDADPGEPTRLHRNFAGSIQLDYMAVPSENIGRTLALDGATAEASLKLAMDFTNTISANVKLCVGCHGVEVGMAYFDLRVADEVNVRIGRFTPAFGEFPLRHDPANHRTSDKPLPYDMGRMVRMVEWNEGVLPAPWVDNGVEVNGTHFFGAHVQLDYAVYAISGPRAGADPVDFDFKLSRSAENYYVDNNSRPAYGGRVGGSVVADEHTWSAGFSMMRGTYDPAHRLAFSIYGAHLVARIRELFFRVEYLTRKTEMSVGEDPIARFRYGAGTDGRFDPHFVKDGGYVELEVPVTNRLTLIAREDGLRRRGNVVQTSAMRSDSALIRHTAAAAIALRPTLHLKLSYEYYDFSDFEDESVIHVGIAGPF